MNETRRSGGHRRDGTHFSSAPAAPLSTDARRLEIQAISVGCGAKRIVEPSKELPSPALTLLEEARAAIPTSFASDEAKGRLKPIPGMPRRRAPMPAPPLNPRSARGKL